MIQEERLPASIGLYRVQCRVGAGGMGVVYLAVSPSGREVAVKVIRQELAEDPEFRTRFRQEVTSARRVSGAFTAAVVDADPDADPPWMATVYIHGTSLRDHVRTRGPLQPDALMELATGLAEALRNIHRAGLVHRDLKPDNVLLTDDGPRVIDFGIARMTDGQTLTHTGRMVGTPAFMAPEQARSAKDAGPAADIFALGATLVYAASGHGPFDASNPYTVAYRVVHEEPDLTHVPDLIHPVIRACLEKNPKARPTAEELLTLLATPWRQRIRPRSSQRVARYMAAGVSLTAVLATAAWYTFDAQRSPHGSPRDVKSSSAAKPAAPAGSKPAVEPAALTRPRGWALWEQKAWDHNETSAACDGVPGALLCTTDKTAAMLLEPHSGHIKWRHKVPGIRYQVTVGAAAGFAYIQVLSNTPPVQLIALSMKDGEVKWSIPVDNGEGVQLIGSTLYLLKPDNHIQTLNLQTGQTLPRHSPRIPTSYGTRTSLRKGDDGNLYVLNDDRSGASITSVDADTLKVLWTATTDDGNPGELQRTDENGAVFVKRANDGRFTALVTLAPDGSLRQVPLEQATGRDGVLSGDTFYTSRPDGTLMAFDATTGRLLWRTELGAESPGKPVVDGTRLYVSVADARIFCLDTVSGRQLWRSAPRRDPEISTGPEFELYPKTIVVVRDTVYARSSRGTIFAVLPPQGHR
ncbi:serine/threonine-protein kinase [Streptomyces sp. NPDC002133]|uniref:serine/threonine-protein kinase n=1 Tax=Streptomyces sp. NPDC002133 TaxID=3154409 RepID=UPI0033198889